MAISQEETDRPLSPEQHPLRKIPYGYNAISKINFDILHLKFLPFVAGFSSSEENVTTVEYI